MSPGHTAAYSVTVRNNDQGGCEPATFALSLTGPAGIDGEFQPAALTIAPGATAPTALAVDVGGGTADGQYQVGIAAARQGGGPSSSVSAGLRVVSALHVTVTTDRTVYRRFQTVTATAVVTAGGAPAARITATFTVKKADGQKVTATATTNAGGVATYRYVIRWTDKKGGWSAKAVARKAGITGRASAPFQVQ